MRRSNLLPLLPLPLLATLLAPACTTEPGTVDLRIYGEPFIEEGIPAEDLVDGWAITFDAFLVVVGDIAIDGAALHGWHVVDLVPSTGGEGRSLGALELDAGRLGALSYRIAPAPEPPAATLAAPELAELVDGRSVYVSGTASRGGETLRFRWAFASDTTYSPCELDRDLAAGGEGTAEITIHADHLFYDDLDSEEPDLAFDLIASADADGDGEITEAELRAVDITGQARYQVGSRTITELWSFIDAQVTTLGHVDGEGHCDAAP